MSSFPPCPKCQSEYSYLDADRLTCPECGHEWSNSTNNEEIVEVTSVKDANGNQLLEGDYATLIKDLKVKGTSDVLKIGTRIKVQRIVDGDHNIDCKIDRIGAMMLKSELVKKSQ